MTLKTIPGPVDRRETPVSVAPPGAPLRTTVHRRMTARRLSLVALSLTVVGVATSVAPAQGEEMVLVRADGLVHAAVLDTLDTRPDAHADTHVDAGPMVTRLLLDVDGTLLDLPDRLQEGLEPGDRVEVTLRGPAGQDAASAVRAAALDPSTTSVVAVAPAEDAESPATGGSTVGPTGDPGLADGPTAAALTGASVAGSFEALQAAARASTTGTRLVVLPVRWAGAGPSEPSAEALHAVTQGAVDYWAEQSGGTIDLTAETLGWRTIPAPDSCGDVSAIRQLALQAHGFSPSAGDHVAVYFPRDQQCGWAGQALLGGTAIWVNGVDAVDVLAHELGHNFRLGHADVLRCTDGRAVAVLTTRCLLDEYYDSADVMGFSMRAEPGNLSAGLADVLGLLTSASPTPGETLTVAIAPVADVTSLRAVEIEGADGRRWYVEYRPAAGRDLRTPPSWSGVQLREVAADSRWPAALVTRSALVLGTVAEDGAARIDLGQELEIPGAGWAVSVLGVTTDSATVRVRPVAPVAVVPGPSSFTDVPAGHPFRTEIAWLSATGITTGDADGGFRPSAPVSRGAMAAFLYRRADVVHTPWSVQQFTDTPMDHPFFIEIDWLESVGITRGNPDGSFGVVSPMSRGAMAAFLYREAGSPAVLPPERDFPDVPRDHPFYREISWLAQSGITTGYADGTFRPAAPVARQAMAAFLYRMGGR